LRLLRALMALLSSMPVAAYADECFHFDTPNSTLNGRITRGERQTAAGHETNEDRDFHWYLQFAKPICVAGKGSDMVSGALQAELWLSGDTSPLGSLDGRVVRVTGHFLPTYVPHYHAYLIFIADSVDVVEQVPPDKSLERSRGG
jgi:hypothetical protein